MKRPAPPCRIRWCSIATIISEYLPSSNVTYEYVVVPGVGAEEDYEGLNVSGKLALIQRGQTNFEDKLAIAVNHGAKGAIIYNNISGALAPAFSTWRGYMIGIALEDGEKLLAAAVDGVGTVTFGPASSSDYNWNTPADVEKTPWTAVMPAYDAGQMSSFSSAGPAPDLSLKPEISAPGGNIISSVIGGGYGIMSGTSMATPHMAGVAALVRNYLRSELDVTDSDALRNMAECLMMSTAVPGKNDNGAEFSPRQQGAGLVDVEQAVTAEGYLSVDGKDGVQRPKAELGWNETGTYAFSFDVHNISGEAVTYTLTASSLTEGITNQDGVDFSAGEVMVTGYDQNTVTGSVTIPETVTCEGDETTYTVTAVGDRLFSSKYKITEVHLPDTITTVGERAFDQIHALEYINIPTGLTTLTGIQAFGYGGWDNLEWSGVWNPDTLVVPGGLETWNVSAFSGNRYTGVVLSEGLKLVGSYGLSNNLALTNVQIAGSVAYLKNNAFSNCSALTAIALPEGLRYIGAQAFMGDPLEAVTLPDSLQYIGAQAFEAYSYDYSTSPATITYTGIPDIALGGGIVGMGWNAFCPEVNVTTVLGSTRNLVVERNSLNNVPTVCWDGKTDIPAGDYSVIPEGVIVTVSEDVRLDGTLIVNGTLIIKAPAYVIGKGEVAGEGRIYNGHRIVETKPFWADLEPSIPILPILLAGSGTNGLPFTDVKTTDWFYDDVVYAYENGLLTGVSADRFAPESSMTRAMLWTVLARLDGVNTDGGATWYEKGREWAMRNGISDGTNPDGSITREQLVTMLWRYAGSPDADASVLNVYADRNEISDWAVTAMAWATENGILNGSNGKVLPTGSATRAQVAAILTRYREKIRK